jgi:hypothetical protein
MYRSLNPELIVSTAAQLQRRITERFPESGLSRVAGELLTVARETTARIDALRQPRWGLRIGIGLLIAVMAAVAVVALSRLNLPVSFHALSEVVQVVDAAINDVVFMGIAIAFLVTIEARIRRHRALKALHELRSLVHIVDMHQLTKDPDTVLRGPKATASSPTRALTPFELGRYLDYCSELLSVTSKVAALYAQQLEDPVVLSAVNEVESLTVGLSAKIWQKLVILGNSSRESRVSSASLEPPGRP